MASILAPPIAPDTVISFEINPGTLLAFGVVSRKVVRALEATDFTDDTRSLVEELEDPVVEFVDALAQVV